MVRCSHCGETVSTSAKYCPRCGRYPRGEWSFAKRFFIGLIAGLIIFGTVYGVMYFVVWNATMGGYKATLSGTVTRYSDEIPYSIGSYWSNKSAGTGMRYAIIYVSIKNSGDKDFYAASLDLSVVTTSGNEYSHSSDSYYLTGYLDGTTLHAGNSVSGYVAFEIPDGAIPSKLIYDNAFTKTEINL